MHKKIKQTLFKLFFEHLHFGIFFLILSNLLLNLNYKKFESNEVISFKSLLF